MGSKAALQQILERQPVWRAASLGAAGVTIASGFESLDAELPGRGWPAGALTELLAGHEGIGEWQLVLPSLARLSASGRRVVCLAPPRLPYAPALLAAGVDLAQMLIVKPREERAALWAAEQALRSSGCAALVAWLRTPRYVELQRLSLAAEAGGGCALLFRPTAAAGEPTPACLRIRLEPAGRALALRILKRRGAPAAAPLVLPLKTPLHALGRPAFHLADCPRGARDERRMGMPVHA